jgi:hypothetical protein
MSIAKRIDRRTFLRGAGAALALPMLDIMSPVGHAAKAAAPVAPAPPRFLWLFQPCGFHPEAWNPKGDGLNAVFSESLKPLEPFQARSTVIRNLWTNANFHAGNVTALLTGRMAEMDAESGRFSAGQSIDQHIADKISGTTRIRSLELGIDSPPSGSCALTRLPLRYGATVSWQTPTQQRMVEVRPLNIYERLFGVDGKSGKQAALHGSILDLVKEEARDIRRIGSNADRQRLDDYLDAVRETERGIQRTLNPAPPDWTPPSRPAESEFTAPPIGVPTHRPTHMKSMLDLLTLALWTDSTRVATFAMGATQCNAHFGFIDGVVKAFHEECSHHRNKPEVIKQYVAINKWHAEQTAYLLKRLDSIDEGGKSLLDNSLVFFGSSLSDGNLHSCEDLPIAMFGTLGGRVRPRGHVFTPHKTPISHLHRTTLGWYGIEAENFNETGAKTLSNLG